MDETGQEGGGPRVGQKGFGAKIRSLFGSGSSKETPPQSESTPPITANQESTDPAYVVKEVAERDQYGARGPEATPPFVQRAEEGTLPMAVQGPPERQGQTISDRQEAIKVREKKIAGLRAQLPETEGQPETPLPRQTLPTGTSHLPIETATPQKQLWQQEEQERLTQIQQAALASLTPEQRARVEARIAARGATATQSNTPEQTPVPPDPASSAETQPPQPVILPMPTNQAPPPPLPTR